MKVFQPFNFLSGLLLGIFLVSFIPQLLQLNTTGTLNKFYTSSRDNFSPVVLSFNLSSPLVYNVSNVPSERIDQSVPKKEKEKMYPPNRGKDRQEQQIVKIAQDIVRRSAFETKWLCLIIVNEAYIKLLENWLCGLHRFKAAEVVIFYFSFSFRTLRSKRLRKLT
jgi:hypothetical protein